jgi:hypothetical protein
MKLKKEGEEGEGGFLSEVQVLCIWLYKDLTEVNQTLTN